MKYIHLFESFENKSINLTIAKIRGLKPFVRMRRYLMAMHDLLESDFHQIRVYPTIGNYLSVHLRGVCTFTINPDLGTIKVFQKDIKSTPGFVPDFSSTKGWNEIITAIDREHIRVVLGMNDKMFLSLTDPERFRSWAMNDLLKKFEGEFYGIWMTFDYSDDKLVPERNLNILNLFTSHLRELLGLAPDFDLQFEYYLEKVTMDAAAGKPINYLNQIPDSYRDVIKEKVRELPNYIASF
jgi:hypothetical protein